MKVFWPLHLEKTSKMLTVRKMQALSKNIKIWDIKPFH